MSNNSPGPIDALVTRAEGDPALRDRLISDPKGTILAETGMKVPDDWAVVARDVSGSIVLGFEGDELPDAYLELVSGGDWSDISHDPSSWCV